MAGGFFTSIDTWEALDKETGFNKFRGKESGESFRAKAKFSESGRMGELRM